MLKTLNVDEETWRAVRQRALDEGVTVAAVVRELLDEALDRAVTRLEARPVGTTGIAIGTREALDAQAADASMHDEGPARELTVEPEGEPAPDWTDEPSRRGRR